MIVKEINGCKIERREHKGNEYFVVWLPDNKSWNKFFSIEKAISFAKSF